MMGNVKIACPLDFLYQHAWNITWWQSSWVVSTKCSNQVLHIWALHLCMCLCFSFRYVRSEFLHKHSSEQVLPLILLISPPLVFQFPGQWNVTQIWSFCPRQTQTGYFHDCVNSANLTLIFLNRTWITLRAGPDSDTCLEALILA